MCDASCRDSPFESTEDVDVEYPIADSIAVEGTVNLQSHECVGVQYLAMFDETLKAMRYGPAASLKRSVISSFEGDG